MFQPKRAAAACMMLVLAGCVATTRVQLSPAPQAPVCDAKAAALVLWAPQWRADQKEPEAREEAAAKGLAQFFAEAACFQTVRVQRQEALTPEAVREALQRADGDYAQVITVGVRELGPVLKIGASPALLEGGTEVKLDIGVYLLPVFSARAFSVHWQNGGAGVIKGVDSLPQDVRAALAAALQASLP
ncbi:MAG: hypothetical protein ACO1RX_23690 [Candidatus Sericytochromatia bacterium]